MTDGWYCDDESQGCIHDFVTDTGDGRDKINTACAVSKTIVYFARLLHISKFFKDFYHCFNIVETCLVEGNEEMTQSY